MLAARRAGHDVVVIGSGTGHDVDVPDRRLIVQTAIGLHERLPFDAAISLTEQGLLPAAEVAESLGLWGAGLKTAQLLMDKVLMRRHLARFSGMEVRFWEARCEADVATALAENGAPVVVKPSQGTASTGVSVVRESSEAERAWRRAAGAATGSVLIEEFLDGPEFSVEAFSVSGEHRIVALTEKTVDPASSVEMGHTIPARVSPADSAALAEHARGVLDALGLRDGPSHTELRLTSRGPRLIESHNRVGGDKIRELVHHATGVDYLDLIIRAATGAPVLPTELIYSGGAAIRFLVAPPGAVLHVSVPNWIEPETQVHIGVQSGNVVGALRSSHDRVGHVISSGRDASSASSRAEKVVAAVLIRTQA